MSATTYTPQELQREAREAALFSQREAARLSRSRLHYPRSVLWSLEIFSQGRVRLNVEYLVKDDEHPHMTSMVL